MISHKQDMVYDATWNYIWLYVNFGQMQKKKEKENKKKKSVCINNVMKIPLIIQTLKQDTAANNDQNNDNKQTLIMQQPQRDTTQWMI